jgi:DNA polymerase I
MKIIKTEGDKEVYVITTAEGLKSILTRLSKEKELTYDLETTGLDPHKDKILIVALSSRTESYAIDFTYIGMEHFKLLTPLLTSRDVVKIGHNIAYDWKMTFAAGIAMENVYDTMIAEQVLTSGLYVPMIKVNEERAAARPFSLEAVAFRRLGIKLDKEMQKTFIGYEGIGFSDRQYLYASDDTFYLYPILDQQRQEIKDKDLEYTVYEIEMPIVPVTSLMELTGMPVNIPALESLVEPFEHYVDVCYKSIQDAFISNGAAERILFQKVNGKATYTAVNPGSKPQMLRALAALNIDLPSLQAKEVIKWDFRNSKRKEGLASISFLELVDDEEIALALDKYGGLENPFLRLYMFYQGSTKLLGTYIQGTLKKVDREKSRLFSRFNQCGARATGRYSSDLQQFPKNDKLKRLGLNYSIRECFATEARSIVIADFSAIELVILADRSEDKELAFQHMQGDLHTIVTHATLAKYVPIAKELCKENKDISPYKDIRDTAKIISYGIAYGVTGKSLAEQMNLKLGSMNVKITPEQGEEFVNIWKHELFPRAGAFLAESADMGITLGYTDSRLGRKRFYDLEEINANQWKMFAVMREASNHRIQATSSDMSKLAEKIFYQRADMKRARLVLVVHDELVVESTNKYAETAAVILKESMEDAARICLPVLGHSVIVTPHIRHKYDK